MTHIVEYGWKKVKTKKASQNYPTKIEPLYSTSNKQVDTESLNDFKELGLAMNCNNLRIVFRILSRQLWPTKLETDHKTNERG